MIFSIYDFEIEIPEDWSVEISKPTNYEVGRILLNAPNKLAIAIIWDSLSRFKDEFPTAKDFFNYQVEHIKGNRHVRSVDVQPFEYRGSEGHSCDFHRIHYISKARFTREHHHIIVGLGVYCEKTNRFFVVFAEYSGEKSKDYDEVAKQVIQSFRCRCDRAKVPRNTPAST
ncbi:MAG: hypothetical protein J7L98_00390 [Candidatus Verstraetearchaeota archaeon]|nr:hypothetical protein [Candidatus Verstraetearchaeota archaeon]